MNMYIGRCSGCSGNASLCVPSPFYAIAVQATAQANTVIGDFNIPSIDAWAGTGSLVRPGFDRLVVILFHVILTLYASSKLCIGKGKGNAVKLTNHSEIV